MSDFVWQLVFAAVTAAAAGKGGESTICEIGLDQIEMGFLLDPGAVWKPHTDGMYSGMLCSNIGGNFKCSACMKRKCIC